MSKKVEVQKGPIHAAERTSKMKLYSQKSELDREERDLRRSGQTLTLHEPKTGRK